MKAWSEGLAPAPPGDRESFESFRRSLIPNSWVVLVLSAALAGRRAEYAVVIDPATGLAYGEPVGNPYGRLLPLAGETVIESTPAARAAVDLAVRSAAAVKAALVARHVQRRHRRARHDAVRMCLSLDPPEAQGLVLDVGEAIEGRRPEPAAWRLADGGSVLEVADEWADGEWRGGRRWLADRPLLVAATDSAAKQVEALGQRVAGECVHDARSVARVHRRVLERWLATVWSGGDIEPWVRPRRRETLES